MRVGIVKEHEPAWSEPGCKTLKQPRVLLKGDVLDDVWAHDDVERAAEIGLDNVSGEQLDVRAAAEAVPRKLDASVAQINSEHRALGPYVHGEQPGLRADSTTDFQDSIALLQPSRDDTPSDAVVALVDAYGGLVLHPVVVEVPDIGTGLGHATYLDCGCA